MHIGGPRTGCVTQGSNHQSLRPTVDRMPVLATQKLHDNQKLVFSRTATQSCSRRDEVVTIHDHDPVMPQRKRSWLPILILVSISFSFTFLFPRALPSWPRPFLIPSFSDDMTQVLSDTTFLIPSSPASSSNGRINQVQWDNYTLVLNGQRVLI
jgi:hypothetical protein